MESFKRGPSSVLNKVKITVKGMSCKISDFFEAFIALHLNIPTCEIPVSD